MGADAPVAPRGLSDGEVRERRARGHVNTLPDDSGRSFLRILQANLFTLFNAIAASGFLLMLVLGRWQDAVFGLFLIANVLIGVVQEFRAKITLSRLSVLHAKAARVLRDGMVREVPVDHVVLDDVLVLSAGDQVVADAVVLESEHLALDESMLTGESDPVDAVVGGEVLSGSNVVAGGGLARVVRVGAASYSSRITAEARRFSLVNSELRTSLDRVIRWISWVLLPVGAIVVNGQMQAVGGWALALESGRWRDAAVASVAALISMVPQGLVFMTSLALALGAVRLGRRGVLVQELAAVEGLARVDTLCLDKTGTLTEGGSELDGFESLAEPPGWRAALGWFGADVHGNATASALGQLFEPEGLTAHSTVEFSSARKWSAVSFIEERAQGTWVLGGADVLLPAGHPALTRADELTQRGVRTLLLTHHPEPMTPDAVREQRLPADLEPVAFLLLRERLRPDAARILEYFRDQDVDVRIISGDDARTVAAVARAAGLEFDGDGFDARLLPTDPAELDAIMATERVFGRVGPEQKKDMVLALQRVGRTVAMTGDGVNDALALKHADLGIAMGSGAAATRAVARIVLLDGQFSHLPRVVAEGRQVIANVERLARLFLTKTVWAITLGLFFGALLLPYPFLPRQLSIVDGLTIGLPALVIAVLPNHPRYSRGFLGRALRFCVPSGLIIAASMIALVLWARTDGRFDTPQVQGAAVIALTVLGLWTLVIQARPITRWKSVLIAVLAASLVVVLLVPFALEFLQVAPPPLELLTITLAMSLVGSIALEVVHRLRRHGAD